MIIVLKKRDIILLHLTGAVTTLKTTKNFWQVIVLYLSKKRRTIIFRNGLNFKLNRDEFISMKELVAEGWEVEQLAPGTFHVAKDKHELTVSSPSSLYMLTILRDDVRKVQQTGPNEFVIETDELKLVGNSLIFGFLGEDLASFYKCNCLKKTVLDIGGTLGESAVVFSKMGAQKVVIYEPVVEHHTYIKKNVELNSVEAELHDEGVGDKNGFETIHYEDTDHNFGSIHTGSKEMVIKTRNLSDVLEESHADIAKLDCEGAEMCLLQVPINVLRKLEYYMIEVHSKEIRAAILKKFSEAGFEAVSEIDVWRGVINGVTLDVSIIHFQRVETSPKHSS